MRHLSRSCLLVLSFALLAGPAAGANTLEQVVARAYGEQIRYQLGR